MNWKFPTDADHERGFASPEYLALTPLRDAGADLRAALLEGYVPDR